LLGRLWSPAFAAALRRLQRQHRFDLVQIEGLELAAYRQVVERAGLVFDDHNVEYLLQRRAFEIDARQPGRAPAACYSLVQWRRLRAAERAVCQAADAVLAVSAADADCLERLSGRPVQVIANGLDLTGLPPGRRAPAEPPSQLLFDGTMSFRPNHDAALWFCQAVLPRLRQRQPGVRFWVVGRDPLPDLVRYNFQPNGVAVTGTVPSVEPYWDRADLYVLPMRMGGGVRFKALEALGRGLPIVSTALGMAGTAARAGRDYLQAETAEEFAAAVLRLLDDAGLRRRLAANARLAAAQHDWARVGSSLRSVYDRLASEQPRRRAPCPAR
jgi:glycosyltransferase involved in cell wall biosynthesis